MRGYSCGLAWPWPGITTPHNDPSVMGAQVRAECWVKCHQVLATSVSFIKFSLLTSVCGLFQFFLFFIY